MRAIEVQIEKGLDGTYDAHFNPEQETGLTFSLLGQGNTVQEAMGDFKNSAEEMQEYYKEIGKEYPEIEFNFTYDVPSFLSYYSNILTLTGLGKLTGINNKQLNHYVTGHRRPSEKTVKKIEKSLHDFADELSQINFI